MQSIQNLAALFDQQKQYINDFFNAVDINKAQEIYQMMLDCKGAIIFSGIGKSGIVAEKLAMTLVSIGIKAIYLKPINALHGDIGIVSKEDLFIGLSRSGATAELLNLYPAVRKKGAKIVSWVSKPGGLLEKRSDVSIYLPVKKELCPFDLSPTTSPAIQMIFGDILSAALMQERQFSIDDYALNHPGGAIGKQITYSVEDLMLTDERLPLCYETTLLKDALVELTNKRCGCLLVVDESRCLKGIFTDGDLRRAIQTYSQDVFDMQMQDLMVRSFMSIKQNALAVHAMTMMQNDPKKRVMMLPVLEQKQIKGLICMHDIVHAGLS